jgi:hypothetical protein
MNTDIYKSNNQFAHPIRYVVYGCIIILLLFLATTLFSNLSIPYIEGGIIYSLSLLVTSVGWVLSGKNCMRLSLFIVGTVIIPLCLYIIILIALHPPLWLFGIFLYIALFMIGLVLLMFVSMSIYGWGKYFLGARYFRRENGVEKDTK